MDIVVPELGESITEATVLTWLVKAGDAVAADQPLVELETDKATLEIGAPKAGVIGELLVAEGEDVSVGAVLGRIVEGDGAALSPPPAPKKAPTAAAPHAAPAPAPARATRAAEAAVPAADAGAGPAIDAASIRRSGPGDRITKDDLQSALGISSDQLGPAARKWIADNDLDPASIPGSGPGGRITKGDVIAFLERPPSPSSPPPDDQTPTAGAPGRTEERVKMSRMRRTIAARLKEAQDTAAILTTFNEADMSAVMALRKKHREAFEERHGVKLGFMSFFAKAAVAALERIPEVNASIDGNEVVYHRYVDIGMAISTPNGLVVPAVRDCQARSFADIERELGALADKAREGSLTVEEMTGGTFSITNGGVFGSLMSTPILNRPQSAILGLHKIQARPVVVDGEIVARPMMYLALSYDHRLVDGREAVTFLVMIKEAIEDPERLLLDL
ncbi:MAG: 2-oxoglutarate dehydrogenase complex dihydrolipoyllysine-residue succinyltransferase [Myxococcales bacterium]|nr:2-oxoglutarate dehydrogenase complex dihydrolipoyllysine-residue succinyltransferase [Myxococcales bacterium]